VFLRKKIRKSNIYKKTRIHHRDRGISSKKKDASDIPRPDHGLKKEWDEYQRMVITRKARNE
jgi:hypothetical protein